MVGSHFRDTREEYRNVSEDIALNIALYFAVSEEKINQYYCLKVRHPSLL